MDDLFLIIVLFSYYSIKLIVRHLLNVLSVISVLSTLQVKLMKQTQSTRFLYGEKYSTILL